MDDFGSLPNFHAHNLKFSLCQHEMLILLGFHLIQRPLEMTTPQLVRLGMANHQNLPHSFPSINHFDQRVNHELQSKYLIQQNHLYYSPKLYILPNLFENRECLIYCHYHSKLSLKEVQDILPKYQYLGHYLLLELKYFYSI